MEAILEPIYRSPKFTQYLRELNDALEREKVARQKFRDSLKDGERAEFINGEVIELMPARPAHRSVLTFVSTLISFHLRMNDDGELHSEQSLVEFTRNDFMPDLAYWPSETLDRVGRNASKMPPPPFLVEILSPSTADRDRGVKLIEYALGGVQEYWIVDADAETVRQHLSNGDVFDAGLLHHGDEVLTSLVLKGFKAPARAFFHRESNWETLQALAAR